MVSYPFMLIHQISHSQSKGICLHCNANHTDNCLWGVHFSSDYKPQSGDLSSQKSVFLRPIRVPGIFVYVYLCISGNMCEGLRLQFTDKVFAWCSLGPKFDPQHCRREDRKRRERLCYKDPHQRYCLSFPVISLLPFLSSHLEQIYTARELQM